MRIVENKGRFLTCEKALETRLNRIPEPCGWWVGSLPPSWWVCWGVKCDALCQSKSRSLFCAVPLNWSHTSATPPPLPSPHRSTLRNPAEGRCWFAVGWNLGAPANVPPLRADDQGGGGGCLETRSCQVSISTTPPSETLSGCGGQTINGKTVLEPRNRVSRASCVASFHFQPSRNAFHAYITLMDKTYIA